MDKGEVTALTLLDLSASFDTIDHPTLTDRLSDWYGISGQAQIWFSSYLKNRHQSVKIEDTLSDKVTLSYGVPQGSVLGPVLFIPARRGRVILVAPVFRLAVGVLRHVFLWTQKLKNHWSIYFEILT